MIKMTHCNFFIFHFGDKWSQILYWFCRYCHIKCPKWLNSINDRSTSIYNAHCCIKSIIYSNQNNSVRFINKAIWFHSWICWQHTGIQTMLSSSSHCENLFAIAHSPNEYNCNQQRQCSESGEHQTRARSASESEWSVL